MARSDSVGPGSAVVAAGAPPASRFRRAKPQDALDLAVETFLGGDRVDMQTLSAQLSVSPATLHRWFGSRGRLLDAVCERLSLRFASAARAEAQGSGDDRTCDYARRVMVAASAAPSLRSFVAREPQLALRLLLGVEGSVHRVLSEQTREVIAETRSPDQARALDRQIHLIVQVSTALVWATFMVGDEPQVDSAVELLRMLLASNSPSA